MYFRYNAILQAVFQNCFFRVFPNEASTGCSTFRCLNYMYLSSPSCIIFLGNPPPHNSKPFGGGSPFHPGNLLLSSGQSSIIRPPFVVSRQTPFISLARFLAASLLPDQKTALSFGELTSNRSMRALALSLFGI